MLEGRLCCLGTPSCNLLRRSLYDPEGAPRVPAQISAQGRSFSSSGQGHHGFVQLSLENLQGQGPTTRTVGSPGSRGALGALGSLQPGWEALLSEQELFWL